MLSKIVMLTGLGLLTVAPVLSPVAMAQTPTKQGYVGTAASSVAGCPKLIWRLARDGDNVTGIAYYSDMSGVSQVKGTVDKDGAFTLQLTSSMGNGPVATVTGQRSAKNAARTLEKQGALEANMVGTGCANMHLTMKPVYNLNTYSSGGG